MTVDDLRALLADAPGDARVLVTTSRDGVDIAAVVTLADEVLLVATEQTGDGQ